MLREIVIPAHLWSPPVGWTILDLRSPILPPGDYPEPLWQRGIPEPGPGLPGGAELTEFASDYVYNAGLCCGEHDYVPVITATTTERQIARGLDMVENVAVSSLPFVVWDRIGPVTVGYVPWLFTSTYDNEVQVFDVLEEDDDIDDMGDRVAALRAVSAHKGWEYRLFQREGERLMMMNLSVRPGDNHLLPELPLIAEVDWGVQPSFAKALLRSLDDLAQLAYVADAK